MRQKDLKQKDNFRCNAILYSLGRVVLLIMVALTVADVVYLHITSDGKMAIGMMVSHITLLLGVRATQASAAAMCYAVAYIMIACIALFSILAGKHYVWSIIGAIIFSIDTLVTLWSFLAVGGSSFLITLCVHIFAQVFAICAIDAGRSLSRSGRGVKGSLKLAVRGV